MRLVYKIGKAAAVTRDAGEGQGARAAPPGGSLSIFKKIERGPGQRCCTLNVSVLRNIDIRPECCIRCIANAELNSRFVGEFPQSFVMSGCGRRGQVDRKIDRLTGSYRNRQWNGGRASHPIAACPGERIRGGPCTGTDIFQPPGFGEGCTRRERSAIRDGDVRYKLSLITKC